MSKYSGSSLWTSVPQTSPAPCDRYKHAVCVHNGNVYLLGGRGKHSLKDFWKYNVVRNVWIELASDDYAPDELEEHSMVPYQGVLYVFGGLRDSAYSASKTPLWLFDTVKEHWIYISEQSLLSQDLTPANKKGHSAVVSRSSMFIYGGYIDMRGTSQEFWRFDMDSRLWSLLSIRQVGPGPRHSHSAIAHQDYMYLYGGLQGLKEQRDLWRWTWHSQTWTCIRTSSSGPSKLMGHSAVVYKDSMLLFGGGETPTTPTDCLWSLNLSTLMWERLPSLPGSTAPHRIHHRCVGLGPKFQPKPPNNSTSKELSISKNKHTIFRPFKNKCCPSSPLKWQPGEDIELQNLHAGLKGSKTSGNSLTFENKVAQQNRDSDHSENETEGTVESPMPDLLLILGGKPLKDKVTISVWQMTLGDS